MCDLFLSIFKLVLNCNIVLIITMFVLWMDGRDVCEREGYNLGPSSVLKPNWEVFHQAALLIWQSTNVNDSESLMYRTT